MSFIKDFMKMFGLMVLGLVIGFGQALQLHQGAYEDLVVSIADTVPSKECQQVIVNLKNALTDGSQYLFNALDSRAYFRSIQIVLPASWPDSCADGPIASSSGDQSDISIVPVGPTAASSYTQQSAGCSSRGDQIYLTHELILSGAPSLGRTIVKEFAKYRYGVFDEHGFDQDSVYPRCYRENEDEPLKVTSCSDMPVHDNGICSNTQMPFNASDLVESTARSSIMFAPEASSVKIFCDEGIHDTKAPTKHNFMCERRSTLDVILQNTDFFGVLPKDSKGITNTTPSFVFLKQTMTRYVMIIEDTKEMMIRDSWTYLRNAIRKLVVYDLPSNSEVGLVMANESRALKVMDITSLSSARNRDLVASNIPYTPGDARAAACLQCAIGDAMEMLKERSKSHGAANSVIILIAPGMEHNQQVPELTKQAKISKIKFATINYPGVFRSQLLDTIATDTDGMSYTVLEKRHNMDTSLLTTYFQLTNVMYNIMEQFYQGNPLDLPIEIHRRELSDDGRNSVTGSFVLDADLGEPARFALFTHNIDSPLIKSLTLWSPSQQLYQAKSENLLSVKIITIAANINETGTWTYKIERFSGNPQPHFIQVTATPRSKAASVVKSRFWTGQNQPGGPLVLYAEVKKRERPVMGAKVEVTVSRPEFNGTGAYKEKFDLLDTGSGDPDVTKGDGIYTRYFSPAIAGGPGMYTFEVTVSDNGNIAYSVPDDIVESDKQCCGYIVQNTKVQPLSSFQRVLIPVTKYISTEDIVSSNKLSIGRVGDLKAEVIPDEMKIRLSWTAPDMGGSTVARYDVKYAFSIPEISEKFETRAVLWDHGSPFPQAPGSDTTFSLSLQQEATLLARPLYLAVQAWGPQSAGSPSNWVRVFVPRPLPPPTPPANVNKVTTWPEDKYKSNDVIDVQQKSSFARLGLHVMVPVLFGVICVAIATVIYSFCCGSKEDDKTKKNPQNPVEAMMLRSLNPDPRAPTPMSRQNSVQNLYGDPHHVGVPVDDLYKDHAIQELCYIQQKQDAMEALDEKAISIISSGMMEGRTLSPFESWSATKLLGEHERRRSPMEMDEICPDVTLIMVDEVHKTANYPMEHPAPPVPPLPKINEYTGPFNNDMYRMVPNDVHPNMYYMEDSIIPTIPISSSMQGSLNSVVCGDRRRRNVTMV